MSFLGWMTVIGGLLLFMALSSAFIRRLPISTSAVYLAVGVALGPLGLNLLSVNVLESKVWFEHLCEVAVIISLFVGGLKLRLPIHNPAWFAAYVLAGPVMLFSIIGVAIFAHYVLGLHPAVALLLGSFLAPTDPVLASAVAVNDAADHDRMRYGLSGEAGFNDGMAFPFVVFGLLWLEDGRFENWIGWWALHRLVWAVPAGLVIGYSLGKGVGSLAIWLRRSHRDTEAPNDFLALALIALSYVAAEFLGAWGFLAAFAGGVGLRRAEVRTVAKSRLPETEPIIENAQVPHPPAEETVDTMKSQENIQKPAVAAGVVVSEIISFGDTAERLLEFLLVVLVGACVGVHWNYQAVPLAIVFFLIVRPVVALLFLQTTATNRMQRRLMSWFGIRGVGSLYYLAYALNHGLNIQQLETVDLTISVVAISILVHGLTAQPLLQYYERMIAREK